MAAAGGCAPMVAQAPFPARADTVVPGDLLGPFDGQVVDAVSGKPVAGAIVQASWSFETGRGLTAPAGGHVQTVATDGEGKYEIDRLSDLPSARSRVNGVAVVIYQRGYVAYRSDRLFDNALGGARSRHDFSQRNNVAKMERWSGAYSHVKHVRFVGGTSTLRRALGSEVVEASLELTSGRVAAAPAGEPEGTAPLDASGLLSIDELRAVTGYIGPFAIEKLGDLPTTGSYDSRHFKATGRAESYDAALRVWRTSPTAAEARYAKLLAEVPHAEAKDEMADRSLRGRDGRIIAVAALDRAHGVVIELTCGLDQCRDANQAAALLRRVMSRADRLGSPGIKTTEEPATEGAPEESPKSPSTPNSPSSVEPKAAEPDTTPPPAPSEDKPFQLKRPEMKR
ncbi:MAG: hypothetical protein JWN44_5288 [Myxococcales bacterium]|nr:hypothetical protein [Myxococcales bacterium]